MALTLRYGYVTADPRKLDKSAEFLQHSTDISATVKENCSIMNPDFIVSASIVALQTCNYVQVPEWGRYYFVDDLYTMPGGRVAIRCHEDVLTSHASEIANLKLYLDRTQDESKRSKYLPDGSLPAETRRKCITLDFDSTPFRANYATDKVYILTVLGGTGQAP